MAATDDLSPGSDYSRRGDVAGLLRQHGWSLISGDNSGDTTWRRPGKPSGISATLFVDQMFYCFSSSVRGRVLAAPCASLRRDTRRA